jgi:enoyl-CoA hydratase/carnithine racemase
MIGLSNAVELITGGENIDARTAAVMGLANDVVAIGASSRAGASPPPDVPDSLLAAAIRMIRTEQKSQQFRQDRERWAAPIDISETELGFLGATASAYIQQQTKGHYPAPLAALEIMLGAAGVDAATACQMEAEGFAQLFGTPINRALLNVFFLRDRNKKDPGVAADVRPQRIASDGIVGAGVMGQ